MSNNKKTNKQRDQRFKKGTEAPKVNSGYTGKTNMKEDAGFNDPAWYDYNPNLLRDAANFPYPSVLGLDTPVHSDAEFQLDGITVSGDVTQFPLKAPGVLSMQWIPSYGVSRDITSALNITGQNIMGYIRKTNSAYPVYEQADLMSLFIAMDSVYFVIEHLKRIYGMARLYNVTNRYVPITWCRAMNVDVAEVASNLANFRARLNTLIARAASISVPSGFKIFDRHKMMAQAVYTDVESFNKSQTYLFVPHAMYKRKDVTGVLELVPVNPSGSADSIMDQLELCLQSLLLSDDIAIMCGDIRKAYDTNLYPVSYLTEDYLTPVIYDPGIRSQIENMREYPIPDSWLYGGGFNITQEKDGEYNSWIEYKPTMAISRSDSSTDVGIAHSIMCATNGIINMHWKDVTPMDTMYATRLVNTIDKVEHDNGYLIGYFSSTGSEIITQCEIWTDPDTAIPFTQYMVNIVSMLSSNSDSNFSMLQAISSFDWHPIVYMAAWAPNPNDSSEGEFEWKGVFCDLDNYTSIPKSNIERMNDIALLSLFNIPSYGVFNS